MRAGEPDPLQILDLPARTQQCRERPTVPEVDAVRVHVLAEQGDLEHALGHERLDLRQDRAGPAVLLPAAQGRNDAKRARVVAADRDRYQGCVRRVAPGRQRRGEHLERLVDLYLGFLADPGPPQQPRQRTEVVRAEHNVNPGRAPDDLAAVLLSQAATDRDLHAGVLGLDRGQVTEVAVEPVVRVLPYRAGIEDHDAGGLALGRTDVARALQQAGQPLGVVDIHLAPVGANLVRACSNGPPWVRQQASY